MARTDTLGHFLTDVADAIRTKGGTSATIQASSFDTAIANLPGGGGGTTIDPKDVNFYDYDGTITNAYTKTEFLALTAMPSNPTHSGLTSQGWNWSLSDAQTFVTDTGWLDVGQMYVTDDGATRLYVSVDSFYKAPYVGIAINGTATIDWGDNSTDDTLTGTSTSTIVRVGHTYAAAGDYVISISSQDDYVILGDANNWAEIFSAGQTGTSNSIYKENLCYNMMVKKVELGSNVNVGSRGFVGCENLESITIPSSLTLIDGYAFSNNKKIKHITYPTGYPKMKGYAFNNMGIESVSMPYATDSWDTGTFNNCYLLKRVTFRGARTQNSYMIGQCGIKRLVIPEGITKINQAAFRYDTYLEEAIIPSTITTMGGSCFADCFALKRVDFTALTAVPTGNSNMFLNVNTNCKLIIPDDLYSTWSTAFTWSTYASMMVKASEE